MGRATLVRKSILDNYVRTNTGDKDETVYNEVEPEKCWCLCRGTIRRKSPSTEFIEKDPNMNANLTRSGSMALLLAVIGATASSAAQSAWVSDSGNVEIRLQGGLQGGTWQLNNAGLATMKQQNAMGDFDVYYQDGNGTRCGYRQRIIEHGAAVVLEPTDTTQSSDLCPSGKFYRMSVPVRRKPAPKPRY